MKFNKLMMSLFGIACSSALFATDFVVTYDSTDATANIQSAISQAAANAGVDRVILQFQGTGTKWISGPLTLCSDLELLLENGVILEGKANAFGPDPSTPSTARSILEAKDINNISITGYGAVIRMIMEDYTSGEYRHCISLTGCSGVSVKGVNLQRAAGDGIYMAGTSSQNYCEDVLIQDIITDGNARQGISIITAKNVDIIDCTFQNTGYNRSSTNIAPEGPFAGIDIEPETSHGGPVLENINITGCSFISNIGKGIGWHISDTSISYPMPVSCSVSNCYFEDNYIAIRGYSKPSVTGHVTVSDCDVQDSRRSGIFIRDWSDNLPLRFYNINLDNVTKAFYNCPAIDIQSETSMNYSMGNIHFYNVSIINMVNDWSVDVSADNTTYPVSNIYGLFTSDSLNSSISLTGNYNNCGLFFNSPVYAMGYHPVAFWSFDEGAGGSTADSSSFESDGTLNNMETSSCWLPGAFGTAIEFDGVDDFINCGSDPSLNLTEELTFEAYIKLTTKKADYKNTVFNAADDASFSGFRIRTGDAKLNFLIGDGSVWHKISGQNEFTLNQWHHIVVTYKANEFVKTYVDGVVDRNQSINYSIASSSTARTISQSGSLCFSGMIDEVIVYNRAISADEVLMAYQGVHNFNNFDIVSYGSNQDIDQYQYEILDGGRSLRLWGNNWKAVSKTYNVTTDTVLEFDFKSSGDSAEINGIGFDDNLSQSSDKFFMVNGSDSWGITDYKDYSGNNWKHYSIPIGTYFTGAINYIFITNDADNNQATDVQFKNIIIKN